MPSTPPAPSPALDEAIRAEALRLGFVRVGFTPVQPLQPAGQHLAQWLSLGFHGEMEYLTGVERADPATVLSTAKTVISVALPHGRPTPSPNGPSLPMVGRIASYAQGGDYHHLLKERLHQLGDFCSRLSGRQVVSRACVDTAPLLERDVARRAGIGFTGKSTMSIIPGIGTHHLLGELLIDLELQATRPLSQGCGRCTACLDDCPTGAFVDAYTLDARRCISYLTIELRGTIPRPLRAAIGAWVFGCDICQDVCPFNHSRRAKPCDPELATQSKLDAPALIDLLTITSSGYKRLVRGTALRRISRPRLQRNAAVALGNSKSLDAVAPLAKALADNHSALVRLHCAWALGELGFPSALDALRGRLEHERDADVISEIEHSINRYNSYTSESL